MTFGQTESAWNENRVSELKRLHKDNWSAGAIANELGAGITRDAVLGKIKRLGLPKRKTDTPMVTVHRTRIPGRLLPARSQVANLLMRKMKVDPGLPPKLATQVADADIPQDQRKTFLELENHQCRWPVGDPGSEGFFFCGHPSADVAEKRPYCARHARLAYQPKNSTFGASVGPSSEAPRPQGSVPHPQRSPAATSFIDISP